jgi:hypothetical protein
MGGGVAVGNNGGDGAGRWRGLRKSICGGGGISTGGKRQTVQRGGCGGDLGRGGRREVERARWVVFSTSLANSALFRPSGGPASPLWVGFDLGAQDY